MFNSKYICKNSKRFHFTHKKFNYITNIIEINKLITPINSSDTLH